MLVHPDIQVDQFRNLPGAPDSQVIFEALKLVRNWKKTRGPSENSAYPLMLQDGTRLKCATHNRKTPRKPIPRIEPE